VPLFYFLLHIYVIHALAVVFAWFRYGNAGFLFGAMPSLGGNMSFPADYGYGLAAVYAIWLAVVALMYPPCLWFARVKQRSQASWLSYL
jgi:hypothetical protein